MLRRHRLKVDEFRPEYAGKVNFYLSAVDNLLRHGTDAPTIGMILCEGEERRHRGVRASRRGQADGRGQLPDVLPTAVPLARGPADLGRPRARVPDDGAHHAAGRGRAATACRRAVALLAGLVAESPGIAPMVRELQAAGALPASAERFGATLRALNDAAHGVDVGPDAAADAADAADAASRFLTDLRRLSGS